MGGKNTGVDLETADGVGGHVVTVRAVRDGDLVQAQAGPDLQQAVYEVLVLGPIELRVEPTRRLHAPAPGHQGGYERTVAPRQRRVEVDRARLAVHLKGFLLVARDLGDDAVDADCLFVPGERGYGAREMVRVPVVVGVEIGHQLAPGVLEAEVAGPARARPWGRGPGWPGGRSPSAPSASRSAPPSRRRPR